LLNEPLPPHSGSIVREVLAELREAYGSETVFFGGRIDFGASVLTDHRPAAARVLCLWMGNVRGLLVRADGSCQPLNANGADDHRWSTARGVCGKIAHTAHAGEVSRLLVYTDGLDPLGERLRTLGDDELCRQAAALRQLPASDDLTLLDIRWPARRSTSPASMEETRT
jgi:hypothetical protein